MVNLDTDHQIAGLAQALAGRVLEALPDFHNLPQVQQHVVLSKLIDTDDADVAVFKRLCASNEGFGTLRNGWIQSDTVGHAVQPHLLPVRLIQQAVNGDSVTKLIEDIRAFASRGSSASEVYIPIGGAAISQTIGLESGLELVPWATVPDDFQKRLFDGSAPETQFDGTAAFARFPARPSCALRASLPAHRVLYQTAMEVDQTAQASRRKQLELAYDQIADAVRCVTVSIGQPVGHLGSWDRLSDDAARRFLGSGYGYGSALFDRAIVHASTRPIELNLQEMLDMYRAFRAFKAADRRVLRIALDRISSALRENTLVDKAIDLGIALEALLLHDVAAGKGAKDRGELKFRIAVRGAAFVGGTGSTRLATLRTLKAAYDHRSTAVHTGELSDPEGAETDMKAALSIGVIIARKLIQLGRFPRWDEEYVVGVDREAEVQEQVLPADKHCAEPR